jgi:hypothetical protein
MRLGAIVPLFLGASLAAPLFSAYAEESPARGIRIVVPDAHGKGAWGKAALTKSVRRTLTEAVGPLIPSRDLSAAQKKLKLKGKKAITIEALTEAGKKTKAQYLLAIDITKEKWLYTARAQLVNLETGQVQMDFRSQYFRPNTEATDRGKRIANRTVQKIETLINDAPAPFSGGGDVASKEKRSREDSAIADKTEPASSNDKLPEGDDPAEKRSRGESKEDASWRASTSSPNGSRSGEWRAETKSPATAKEGTSATSPAMSTVVSSSPPASSSGSSSSTSNGGSAKLEIQPTRVEDERPEILRFGLNGGAGLLHTYDLSSANAQSSRLSYRLEPLALVAGSAEFVLPGIPIGIATRAAFRPVRFQISVDNAQPSNMGSDNTGSARANQPSGKFLDLAGILNVHLAISGSGRQAFKLIPGVGIKMGILNVEQQPGNLIVSSTQLAAVGAFGLRMPLNDVLELDFGIDGGPIFSFKESPASSGASAAGFTLGGDFSARIWLSSAIGIAFDTRFDYDKLSFSGAATRTMVTSEMLESVSTITKDLRTGIGIAFRL